jgi:hypothetical protein
LFFWAKNHIEYFSQIAHVQLQTLKQTNCSWQLHGGWLYRVLQITIHCFSLVLFHSFRIIKIAVKFLSSEDRERLLVLNSSVLISNLYLYSSRLSMFYAYSLHCIKFCFLNISFSSVMLDKMLAAQTIVLNSSVLYSSKPVL